MDEYPQVQFQFIKNYFLKHSIAKQIIPDNLDDIYFELDDHSIKRGEMKSDLNQKNQLQIERQIQQNSQPTDTSTQNYSFKSQGILKNTQIQISNKRDNKKSHQKKVHFL